jgi:hypothetical protein
VPESLESCESRQPAIRNADLNKETEGFRECKFSGEVSVAGRLKSDDAKKEVCAPK